jgi:methyl halide transferase
MNMLQLDKTYWTNRYLTEDVSWDAGSITAPLKEYINQLTNKNISILIPGAGNSWEAEYLFKQGFRNVVVIDISSEPLNNLRKRLPEFPESNLIEADFFKHAGQYDLILEQTFFCAIDPSMRAAYANKMNELLKLDGHLAGVLFDAELNKNKPPFGGTKEEYITYFTPYFEIKIESCYNSIAPRAGRELFIRLKKK